MHANVIDITGQRFGTFTVRGRAPRVGKSECAWWLVRCDCGAERNVNSDLLRRGRARCLLCGSGHLDHRAFSIADILSSKSEFITECGCQIWMGSVTSKGYGFFGRNNRDCSAHRASWVLANGPIPRGLWVLHRCDIPACINPDHLFLGTAADNTADMIRKGRGVKPPNRWLTRRAS